MTQVQLAERSGPFSHRLGYRRDGRRLSAEMAVRFAQRSMSASMSCWDLAAGVEGRKPSRKILRRLERIEKLPRTRQLALLRDR